VWGCVWGGGYIIAVACASYERGALLGISQAHICVWNSGVLHVTVGEAHTVELSFFAQFFDLTAVPGACASLTESGKMKCVCVRVCACVALITLTSLFDAL